MLYEMNDGAARIQMQFAPTSTVWGFGSAKAGQKPGTAYHGAETTAPPGPSPSAQPTPDDVNNIRYTPALHRCNVPSPTPSVPATSDTSCLENGRPCLGMQHGSTKQPVSPAWLPQAGQSTSLRTIFPHAHADCLWLSCPHLSFIRNLPGSTWNAGPCVRR